MRQLQNARSTAANHGRTPCVQLLLEAGANFEIVDTQGFSPLMHAARRGHIEATQLLLDAGVRAHHRVQILIAGLRVQTDGVTYVLQANPDLGTIKGSDLNNEDGGGGGETALMLAINNAHDSAVKVDAKVPTVFRGEPVRHLSYTAHSRGLAVPLSPAVSAGDLSSFSRPTPVQSCLRCFEGLPS